jgi:predicted lipoprotein with Yx(FWY)xxD motif
MNASTTRSRPGYPLFVIAGGAVAAAVLAGCGGSGGYGASGKKNVAATGSARTTVTTRSGPSGTFLADGAGRTLYVFSADTGTHSRCAGDCAKEWAPFTLSKAPKPTGFTPAAAFALSSRPGGQQQVTYAGHPLYYFAGDTSAGQASGQGLDDFGGVWSTVTVAGKPTSGGSSPVSPPASSGGGYSYSYGH